MARESIRMGLGTKSFPLVCKSFHLYSPDWVGQALPVAPMEAVVAVILFLD
jgi:hypothetical protein